MILLAVAVLFITVLIICTSLVIYARKNYGVLEASRSFPVLKPTFFMGSVPDLHLKIQTEEDIRRFQRFGPIWGVINTYEYNIIWEKIRRLSFNSCYSYMKDALQ